MDRKQLKDWRDEIKTELEDIDSDLEGAIEELKEIRERIAGLRQMRSDRKATLTFVRTKLQAK